MVAPTDTQTLRQRPSRPSLVPAAPQRIQLAPVQKLLRVHLAAQQHERALAEMLDAAQRVLANAGAQLKTGILIDSHLSPATLQPAAHVATRGLFVVLDCGGECLALLELDLLAAGALVHALSRTKEPMGPPKRLTAIEEAGLGWVLLTALSDARGEAALSNWVPRLVTVTMDRSEALRFIDSKRRHAAALIQLTIGGLRTHARLLLPALWLQSKLEQLPDEPPHALSEQVGAAKLPVRVFIGSALLPRGEFSSLNVGDRLFVSGIKREAAGLIGHGRLVGPSFELRGEFTETGFSPTHLIPLPTQESAMSSPVDPSLPVEVEIELTRLRLPLCQLGAIKPGAVMPLHINAAQQVVVRIGDRAVARAELVEVEGEVGARIISML